MLLDDFTSAEQLSTLLTPAVPMTTSQQHNQSNRFSIESINDR